MTGAQDAPPAWNSPRDDVEETGKTAAQKCDPEIHKSMHGNRLQPLNHVQPTGHRSGVVSVVQRVVRQKRKDKKQEHRHAYEHPNDILHHPKTVALFWRNIRQ